MRVMSECEYMKEVKQSNEAHYTARQSAGWGMGQQHQQTAEHHTHSYPPTFSDENSHNPSGEGSLPRIKCVE